MVSHEIKLSPEEIRKWCLSDLIEMVSDIISKSDIEMYTMYCENNK